ncbi:VpsR-related response regulator [Caballeronia terrestris]|uniref:VpsR-related response regulator n=1 Tax=Caballeronia terrestris TaxID=1226301 RepID=UPI0035B54348
MVVFSGNWLSDSFNDAVVRRLICNYCFDYVSLPISNEPDRQCRRPRARHGVITR